jgi:hypothetical protein
MYFAKTAQKLREQMVQFSGELSAGLPQVSRRLTAEMIFGIQARGSVRLTEVGRARDESIPLKKTEDRRSRQLGRDHLDEHLQRRLIQQAVSRIEEDTLLILDLSDVTKKHAQKMENSARVHDGSEKDLGILDGQHRWGEHERDEDRPSLRVVVFACGRGSFKRERGDPNGDRNGIRRRPEAWDLGYEPRWLQGLSLSISAS